MKNRELLKAIDKFEKLAVYGNRRSFLTSLAENNFLSPEIKEKIKEFAQVLEYREGESELANGIISASNSPEFNLDNLLAAIDKAKVFLHSKNPNSSDLKDANQLYNEIKRSNVNKGQFQYIDPFVQKALHYLGAPGGLVSDGKLGPKTRAALNWYKNKNQISDDAAAMNQAIKDFQTKFPNMQTTFNDSSYSEKPIE